jgi:hypothetical protein
MKHGSKWSPCSQAVGIVYTGRQAGVVTLIGMLPQPSLAKAIRPTITARPVYIRQV